MNRLANYITMKMALDALGAQKRQNTRLYRMEDVEKIKAGSIALINRNDFLRETGLQEKDVARFPIHIAIIPVNDALSVGEAANLLGITREHASVLVRDGTLESWDMRHWGIKRKIVLKPSVIYYHIEREHRKMRAALNKKVHGK